MSDLVTPPLQLGLGIDYYSLIIIISGLLIMIHFGFVALSYMISKLLSNPSLEGFSKHELQQAFYSLIIIGSVFSGILVVNNLFCVSLEQSGFTDSCFIPTQFSFEGLNGVIHLNVARSKLGLLYNDVRVLSKGTLRAYDWMDYISNLESHVGLTKWISIPFLAHSKVHAIIYSESFDILSGLLVFLKIQELFLIINSVYFFPPFLYFGLVLRILPFTRKLGGLLIAICLSLFFVLPYLYIAGWVVIESAPGFGTKYIVDTSQFVLPFVSFNVMGNDDVIDSVDYSEVLENQLFNERDERKEDTRDSYKYIIEKMKDDGLIDDELNILVDDKNKATEIGNFLAQAKYVDSNYLQSDAANYLKQINNYRNNSFVEIVARIVISTLFVTLVALVGTISAIKEISMFLGGDVEIAGLTRLI